MVNTPTGDEEHSCEGDNQPSVRASSVNSETATGIGERRCWNENTEKIVVGCVIVVLLAVSWVGTQQFSQNAVQLASFDAPYFTTWLGTCWMTFCYPIYAVFVAIRYRDKDDIIASIKDSFHLFGNQTITVRLVLTRIFPMNILWVITNYLYIFGLKYIAATDASAIFASNVAFVYMLSLCILHERLYFIRILACVICITGVVLFAYVEGFAGGSDLLAGVLLATASAFGAALYKVVFKILVGTASLGQVTLFLTSLGVCNALFMWTIFVVLYFTGVENFGADDIPWDLLIYANFLSLVFNFLVNFGVAYTYPLFISIAMMLGVPLNAAVDIVIKEVSFSGIRLLAAVLVVLGFLVMLFPDRWNDPVHAALCCNRTKSMEDREAVGGVEKSEQIAMHNQVDKHDSASNAADSEP